MANQALLQAVRALEEVAKEEDLGDRSISASVPMPCLLNDKLRRTQAMIEETRAVTNRTLSEWTERGD